MSFLRVRFGRWFFDPVEKVVLWDDKKMAKQYTDLEAELDNGLSQLKAASQPALPPGPPVRIEIFEPDKSEPPFRLAPPK